MNKQEAKTGNLTITLATFIYLLHDNGNLINDPKIKELCDKITETIQRSRLQTAVPAIQKILEGYRLEANDEAIQSFLNGLYGDNIFDDVDIHSLGMELVAAIEETLDPNANSATLYGWLTERYDNIANTWDFNSRDELISNIRKHSFQSSLPWLAQIAERQDDKVVTHWVMVEKFTDTVSCMDPYPWDDIDEEYELPLTDFMVRWELAGTNSIRCGLSS